VDGPFANADFIYVTALSGCAMNAGLLLCIRCIVIGAPVMLAMLATSTE
jgi:hypothetical protein